MIFSDGCSTIKSVEIAREQLTMDNSELDREIAATKTGRSNPAIKLANTKPTRDMLLNRHEDPSLNREQMIKNFVSRWIGDLWLNEVEFRDFVNEAWEYSQNAEEREAREQIERLKANPLTAKLLLEELQAMQPATATTTKRSKATVES